jgi:hypothetical protein
LFATSFPRHPAIPAKAGIFSARAPKKKIPAFAAMASLEMSEEDKK